MTKKVEKIELTPFQYTVDRFMSTYGEKGHSLILDELMRRIANTDSTTQLQFFLSDVLLIISYCVRERIQELNQKEVIK